jgi:hypothetical protein
LLGKNSSIRHTNIAMTNDKTRIQILYLQYTLFSNCGMGGKVVFWC